MTDHTREATSAIEAIDVFMGSVPQPETTATAGRVTLTEARPIIGDIVRAAGVRHQRTTITDRGQPVALVVHPDDWENLVDSLAHARNTLARINGTAGEPVSADEAHRLIFGGPA